MESQQCTPAAHVRFATGTRELVRSRETTARAERWRMRSRALVDCCCCRCCCCSTLVPLPLVPLCCAHFATSASERTHLVRGQLWRISGALHHERRQQFFEATTVKTGLLRPFQRCIFSSLSTHFSHQPRIAETSAPRHCIPLLISNACMLFSVSNSCALKCWAE